VSQTIFYIYNKCLKDSSGRQPFCNRGPVNACQFYRGQGVLLHRVGLTIVANVATATGPALLRPRGLG